VPVELETISRTNFPNQDSSAIFDSSHRLHLVQNS